MYDAPRAQALGSDAPELFETWTWLTLEKLGAKMGMDLLQADCFCLNFELALV